MALDTARTFLTTKVFTSPSNTTSPTRTKTWTDRITSLFYAGETAILDPKPLRLKKLDLLTGQPQNTKKGLLSHKSASKKCWAL